MFYKTYTPGPPLDAFVDYFWLFEGGQTPRNERIIPSGTSELVVNLRDDEVRIQDREHPAKLQRFSGGVLSGAYSSVFVIDAMQHESMLGVHFKPGGAFRFLGTSATDLTDEHVDLVDLWGQSALELRERLCAASTDRNKFHVMKEVLNYRLSRSRKGHTAVPIALLLLGPTGKGARVRDVAREVGICQRRLNQVFAAQVGLSPKLYSRILRFERARALADQHRPLDWAQLAATCGYFDQSHLINDFQEFSGLSPCEYVHHHQPDSRLKSHHVPIPG
jgi:AraC-type DNA-binding domain-containing proteins